MKNNILGIAILLAISWGIGVKANTLEYYERERKNQEAIEINRKLMDAQEEYYKKNNKFAKSIKDLDVKISSEYFKFLIKKNTDQQSVIFVYPNKKNRDLFSWVGLVTIKSKRWIFTRHCFIEEPYRRNRTARQLINLTSCKDDYLE